MLIMSLISLSSPMLSQWNEAFFTTRLVLGLASVTTNADPRSFQMSEIIKIIQYIFVGSSIANYPTTFLALVGTGRTRHTDWPGFRRLHVGQFNHFPHVGLPMRIWICWWMAIHLLLIRLVHLELFSKCLTCNRKLFISFFR